MKEKLRKIATEFLHKTFRHIEGLPDVPTVGIVNELEDGYYVFVADYDNVDLDKVVKDTRLLSNAAGLCTFAILCNHETEMVNCRGVSSFVGNYNVIGLDRLTFSECFRAIMLTRCDEAFKSHILHYPKRNWVIRLFDKYKDDKPLKPKPRLRAVISYHPILCSKRHSTQMRNLLEVWFGAKLPRLRNWDNIREDLVCVDYSTKEGKV